MFEGFVEASSEREALLETQLTGLRQQLDAKDAELLELRQQKGQSAGCICLYLDTWHAVKHDNGSDSTLVVHTPVMLPLSMTCCSIQLYRRLCSSRSVSGCFDVPLRCFNLSV